ncbi:MAG: DUF1707 domain-containing protein [Solirubrobacterales bacterium]|nr:DUF1707 domain-containing protein [Solirubrobacterales bacterium]
MRASDAERERAAERLRGSHAEGRLDLTEFQERLERCYAAKTHGQLAELVSDLPRAEQQVERRSRGRLAPWSGHLPVIPILIALVLVAAAAGHHLVFLWIPIVFLFWRMSWWRRRRSWAAERHRPDDWI